MDAYAQNGCCLADGLSGIDANKCVQPKPPLLDELALSVALSPCEVASQGGGVQAAARGHGDPQQVHPSSCCAGAHASEVCCLGCCRLRLFKAAQLAATCALHTQCCMLLAGPTLSAAEPPVPELLQACQAALQRQLGAAPAISGWRCALAGAASCPPCTAGRRGRPGRSCMCHGAAPRK